MTPQTAYARNMRSGTIALMVSAATATFLLWLAGSRYLFIPDEGIYLDGALRMVRGEVPYRDFFALTGPGTYWIQYASLKLLGVHLWSTRVPVVLDLALLSTLLFWLIEKLSGRGTALAVTVFYLALQTSYFTALQANHRWDSSALAFASVACTFHALAGSARPALFFAGFLSAAAAWATPTMTILLATMLLWLMAHRQWRRLALLFFAGALISFTAGSIGLVCDGALSSMVDHFRWSAGNYAGANRTAYGWVVGGYAEIFRGASGFEAAARLLVLAFITLPATLPPLCILLWLLRLRHRDHRDGDSGHRMYFLLCCGAALLASTYPRPDLTHLMYVSPLFYALGGSLVASLLSRRWKLPALGLLGLAAGSFLSASVSQRLQDGHMQTIVGKIHGSRTDLEVVDMITTRIQPGDTLFVYPYAPIFYFLTGAHNPTRYSFLQPGMFTHEDEKVALDALVTNPPRWILYFSVDPQTYLRTWPSSDPSRLRMPSIEEFIRARYRIAAASGRFQLMEAQHAGP